MTHHASPLHSIEPLETRIALTVNLVMSDVFIVGNPTALVPGDEVTVTYKITNKGTEAFSANNLDVNFWLSKQLGSIPYFQDDPVFRANYVRVVNGAPDISVNLAANGGSVVKKATFTLPELYLGAPTGPGAVFDSNPFNLAPGAGYYIIAEVDGGFRFPDETHEDNSSPRDNTNPTPAADLKPFEWAFKFGKVGTRSNVDLAALDADGTQALFSLTSAGTGELKLQNNPNLTNVEFTNTTADSFASVLTFKGDNDGRITLNNITALSAIKGIKFPGADVTGNVNTSAIAGLQLGKVGGDKTITLGGVAGTNPPTTVILGRVTNLNLAAPAGLAVLQVVDWQDTGAADVITTAFISDLEAKGDKTTQLPGNFGADLVLSGADAKNKSLGVAYFTGQIANATFRSTLDSANMGNIVADSASQWSMDVAGQVDFVGIGKDLSGATATGLKAESFGTVSVKGKLANHLTATGTRGNFDPELIDAIVAGSIDGINISAEGGRIAMIETGEWINGGQLKANGISKIITKGGAGATTPGDFTAAVTAPAIYIASIAGALKGGTWKGLVQKLTAGSVAPGWSLDAVSATTISVDSLVVKGSAAGTFQAVSFGKIDIGGDFTGSITATGDNQVVDYAIGSFSAKKVAGTGTVLAAPNGLIKKFAVKEWVSGNLTARDVDGLKISGGDGLVGDFKNATVTITGGRLGKVVVAGSLVDAVFSAPNSFIESVAADEWISSNPSNTDLLATRLGGLFLTGDKKRNLVGDMGLVRVQVTGADAKLSKVSVAGYMNESTLAITGDVGTIKVLGMIDAAINAGLSKSIDSLIVEGLDGVNSFGNSNVSAGQIGKVQLNNVEITVGGSQFGITADKIGKYVRTVDGSAVKKLANLDAAGTNLDPVGPGATYRLNVT